MPDTPHDEQPTWEQTTEDGSPWHAHWSSVWRLDDEASRQLVIYCRDVTCHVEAGDIGTQLDDGRFRCDYCPAVAVLVTLEPTDGGKSAACTEHAEQLGAAYLLDAQKRDEQRQPAPRRKASHPRRAPRRI